MPTLSTSIIKKQIASASEVQQAIARQAIYGGDLATNLLELSLVSEDDLLPLLADSVGLAPGPVGELPPADAATLRLVPRDMASRYHMYPLSEDDGIVHLAVSEPLPREVEEDLSFSLGATLLQKAVPLVRIQQALYRDYGIELDERFGRLVARLSGQADPNPSSIPSSRLERIEVPALPNPESLPPPPAAPSQAPGASGVMPKPPVKPAPNRVSHLPTAAATTSLGPAPTARSPSATELASHGGPPSSATSGQRPSLDALRRSTKGRPRRVGPYSAAMAESDLVEAETRDDVIRTFFDFVAQYFDYAALFAVHGDLAEGREAHGAGASRAHVNRIGIPLDLPSTFATVKNQGGWQLARLSNTGIDGGLAKDLGRRPGRAVLLLPVTVRGRCVMILYGDHGEADVELSSVGDVIGFAHLVSAAFERLILKKKLGGRASISVPKADAPDRAHAGESVKPEEGRSALMEALHLSPFSQLPPTAAAVPHPAARADATEEPGTGDLEGTTGQKPQTSEAPPAGYRPILRAIEQLPELPERPRPLRPIRTVKVEGSMFPRTERSGKPGASPAVSAPPKLESEPPEEGWEAAEGQPSDRVELDGEDWEQAAIDSAPLAPDSRAAAHSARPLPAGRSDRELKLPSVIVDLESDCQELVRRLDYGDLDAEKKLIKIGAPAIPALAAQFPGRITRELKRGQDGVARASECGPSLRVLARIGEAAVPFLIVRSADNNPVLRAWATRLLGEMPTVESARAVASRFADDNEPVRLAAVAAARMLQGEPEARRVIRDALCAQALKAANPAPIRLGAIEALADVRDGQAVGLLIELLSDGESDIRRSAHWALCVLTRQDFGRDPEPWSAWWTSNSSRHRIEWLIDSLLHDSEELRRSAGDELKGLTKEYFGYYEDLPRKERARAQARYREWWDDRGRVLFR